MTNINTLGTTKFIRFAITFGILLAFAIICSLVTILFLIIPNIVILAIFAIVLFTIVHNAIWDESNKADTDYPSSCNEY